MKRLWLCGLALVISCSSSIVPSQDDAEVRDLLAVDPTDALLQDIGLDSNVELHDAFVLLDTAQSEPDLSLMDPDASLVRDAEEEREDVLFDASSDVSPSDAQVHRPMRDTVITLLTTSEYPALVLTAELYARAQQWRQTTQVRGQDIAVVVFDREAYPTEHLCGVRLNAEFFNQSDDVDVNGQIVGHSVGSFCRTLYNGQHDLDPRVAAWIDVDGVEFDLEDLVIEVLENGDCHAVLVLDSTGDCAQ